MAPITLLEAAERIGLSPLEIAIKCALRGFPCEGGLLDDAVLPILGTVQPDTRREGTGVAVTGADGNETDEERRLRVVRRVLERLARMGKYLPSRTEKRSTGRGLQGSDVGLALRAVDIMLECGLMGQEQHGGREQKVGLNGERRREIADIIDGRPVLDEVLVAWIIGG